MGTRRACGAMVLTTMAVAVPTLVFSSTDQAAPLPGHLLPALVRAEPAGPDATGESLTVTLVLRREEQAAFEAHLAALQDRSSPAYRRFLSQREIADRFGPSVQSRDLVAGYLRSKGLEIVEQSTNRLTVTARGSRAEIEGAFSVRVGDYRLGDRRFHANEEAPALPPEIASHVVAIAGLSDLARPQPQGQAIGKAFGAAFSWLKKLATPPAADALNHAAAASSSSAASNGTVDPPDGWLGNDGSGETIGVLAFDTFEIGDIADWIALLGLPPTLVDKVSRVSVGAGASPGPNQAEVLLDVTAILSVAPGAEVVVYEGPFTGRNTSFQRLFNRMLDDGVDIITNSWAYCEDQTTLADVESLEAIFQNAAMAGVTVLNASGDTGSTCLDGSPNTAAVPASAPGATAVGGTSLQKGPVFLYEGETWWNGSSDAPPTGQGGFGESQFFSRPGYQDGFTVSPKRSVPDVVVNADPASGVVICQADDGGCPSGRLYGGTSIAAPIWAAFVAILNEAGGSNLGALNPLLYPLADSTGFHDAASMGSDFSHVGLGSPNLNALHLLLKGQSAGLPDPSQTEVGQAYPVPGPLIAPVGAVTRPTEVPADGTTEAFVLVRLRDAGGNTIAGKTVTLASSGGDAIIEPASAVTSEANGAAMFRVTNLTAETLTFTATDTTDAIVVGTTPPITFSVPPAATASIEASLTDVVANGVSTTTITVTLQDGLGRPAPGKVVTLFQGSGHSIIAGPVPNVTDATGRIQFSASNRVNETVTYTAVDVTDGDLDVPGSAVVTFHDGSGSACGTGAAPTAEDGYVLEPFATGFDAGGLSFGGVNFSACSGAVGPGFFDDHAYVADFRTGDVYRLPAGGGAATSDTRLGAVGPTLGAPAAGKDGRLYATRTATTGNFFTGAIVEIDPDTGLALRTVASGLTCPQIVAVDPLSGDLFANGQCFGAGSDNPSLWRVRNPGSDTPSLEIYATLPGTPNGSLSFSPDGTLYVAVGYLDSTAPVYRVSGTDKPMPPTVTEVPGVETLYWVTVAEVDDDGEALSLITLSSDGADLRLTDLTTDPVTNTAIAHGIGSGVIGPDGCLYTVVAGTSVYRLKNADGPCRFSAAAGSPTLTLTPAVVTPDPVQGSSRTFTATLQGVDDPEGIPVYFDVIGANAGLTMVRAGADGVAELTYTAARAGDDVIVASASVNDEDLTSAKARVTWTEGVHATFLSLNASVTSGVPGLAVEVRAMLGDASQDEAPPVVGATVEFDLDGQECSGITDDEGVATCEMTPTTIGIATLTASFAGTDDLLPSTGSVAFTVAGEGTTTTTLPAGTCADPDENGNVTAADALFVLRAAVGSLTCPACVCDADGSGATTASDALRVLRVAVGLDEPLDCPACS